MPHSNFKKRYNTSNSGVWKCPCDQTFDFVSERDIDMTHQIHRKVCPNLPEGHKHMRTSKKAMTLKEVQCDEAVMMRRVFEDD